MAFDKEHLMHPDNQDELERLVMNLHSITNHSTQAAIAKGSKGSLQVASHIAIHGIAGPLHVLAMTIGENRGEENEVAEKIAEKGDFREAERLVARRVNPDTVLFSALLAAFSVPALQIHKDKGFEFCVESGAHVVLQACDAFEKLTGRKPDEKLNSSMIKHLRENEKVSSLPLDKFLAGLGSQGPRTLN